HAATVGVVPRHARLFLRVEVRRVRRRVPTSFAAARRGRPRRRRARRARVVTAITRRGQRLRAPAARVQRLLQDLARLEREHATLADLDRIARLRVASWTLALVAQDEIPEPAHLDLLTACERLLHHLEDLVHELGGLLAREPADLRVQRLDDLSFGHDRLP